MLATTLTDALLEVLDRPDLRTIAEGLDIRLSAQLRAPFRLAGESIVLGELVLRVPRLAATVLRHAVELARLRACHPHDDIGMLSIAAARVAACFHALDGNASASDPALPWLDSLAGDKPVGADVFRNVWPALADLLPEPHPEPDMERLAQLLAPIWFCLAPTEALMAYGGDARLVVDSATGLNRYGCSHRPRPWAVTFASSTASSLSERGFLGAEAARRALVNSLVAGSGYEAAVRDLLVETRASIARVYGLPSAERVILAASGTDCELAVLAAALQRSAGRSISNILIAPDETGTGVPLAAQGRHFAGETACRDSVVKGARIDGFPDSTRLIGVPIRTSDGFPRSVSEINDDCVCLVETEIDEGRNVILHHLDMSKTGLVGPDMSVLTSLHMQYPGRVDTVVDACQARLDVRRIGQMVDEGAMVMVTGSKFFTGPPFCGALLLPEDVATRFGTMDLPRGLADYFASPEWPTPKGASSLCEGGNVGLALRWQAALAEIEAFGRLPASQVTETLMSFRDVVLQAVENNTDLTLLPPPSLDRAALSSGVEVSWDTVPTIFSFLIRDPENPFAPLSLEDARLLHRWLNADLSPWVADAPLAGLLCHLGQPVPVQHPGVRGGGIAGALRICAGARLVSGEPSHAGLGRATRLEREFEDARRCLRKISLILRHWEVLLQANPVPHYAPLHTDISYGKKI